MRALTVLQTQAAAASSKLVDCEGCTKCCEVGGLVYIRDYEIAELKKLDVPLFTSDGITFIKRLADGKCPMLNQAEGNCSIYANRPLCCRLFPLDVLQKDGKLHWVLSTDCPDERKMFKATQDRQSTFGFGTVAMMALSIDGSLSNTDVEYFSTKERVAERIDILDDRENEWMYLRPCSEQVKLPLLMSKKETAKEKFKRKLKEKERQKKKRQEKKKKRGKK
jgi:Fe-S-cluster containining protein